MNLHSIETRRNPYPGYSRMRSGSPVHHDPASDLWMIFDYGSVKQALTDHETFSSSMFTAGRRNPEWLIFFDSPRHTKLRALVSRAFTPRSIAGLEPRIRELAAGLLERASERGAMDFAADFSVPLPLMVIAEMLGIPSADWQRFRRWSDVILDLSYTISGGEEALKAAQEYQVVTAEMSEYLVDLLDLRRSTPQDDLLTRLVQAEVEGERLTHGEILGFFQLLLLAGHETTTNLLNNAILSFIEHPDELARLRARPELLPSAIEEVLRYRSPVQATFRATRREIEMKGEMIPAGKLVLVMIGSANRDPEQFSEPERFNITRDPNPHVAFGSGFHFCLGAPLSRLEARIALADILERMPRIELASNEPWEPRRAFHVHGPISLPIRFEAGAKEAALT